MATPLRSEQRAWRRRVFAATWFSYAGMYFCRKPFFIAKASLGDEMAWDATTLGWLGSAYLIAYTVGQFVAAIAGNRWGPRILLLVGMAVSIGANLAFGFANSYATFAVLLVLNGLAQATGWPGNVGAMSRWFNRSERGTVMGLWATNYQVGGVAANTLAAWSLGEWGFRFSYIAGSVVLAVVWVFFYFNQQNSPRDVGLEPIVNPDEEREDSASEGNEDAWPRAIAINVCLIGVFYFFIKFIRYAIWSWTPYMLQKNYGLAGDDAGYLSTIFDLAGILGVVAAGALSDKLFGGRRVRISFYFVLALGGACASLMFLGPHSLLLFGVSLASIGFFLYGPDALMTGAAAIEVGSIRRATLCAGIINGMGSIGSVAQEFIMGPILDAGGTTTVFAVLLFASFMATLCMILLILRNRSGQANL